MADKEILELEVKSNIEQATKDTQKLEASAKKAQGGFKGLGTVIRNVGTALKAAGIGLIVALVAKFMQVLGKNQKVLDFFNTSMNVLSSVFSQFAEYIVELAGKVGGFFKSIFEDPIGSLKKFGQAIINNIVERIRSFLDMIGHLSTAIKELVQGNFDAAGSAAKEAGKEFIDVMTGVDDTYGKVVESMGSWTDMFNNMSNDIKKAVDQAKTITALEKAAGRAEIELQKTALQAQKNAEIQRQIRDDETKTFAERIEANQKLNDILVDQLNAEKKVQQIIISKARAQYNMNKNEENFLALEQAKIGLLEIEERITGQLSEQKTNQVALTKEQQEAENELRVSVLDGLDAELEELKQQYEEKLKLAEKSEIDTTALTEKYEKDRKQIIKENQEEIDDLKDDQADKDKQRDKDVLSARHGLAKDGLRLVGEIAGEGSKIAKAAAIAEVGRSGVEAVQNAYTSALDSPLTKLFPAYPFVQAGLAASFSALQLRKIMSDQTVSPGDGGGGGPDAVSSAIEGAGPSPQMLSGSFSLGQGQAPEPVKAFVVTDEMTNSQNQLANIRRRSTI